MATGVIWATKRPPGRTVAQSLLRTLKRRPARRTRRELVVGPAVPMGRVEDASRIRTADRGRGNALRLTGCQRVAHKRRLEHRPDTGLRLCCPEGGGRTAPGRCGDV